MLINIIYVVFLSIGLFLLAADLLHLPTMKASKAVKALSSRQNTTPSSIDVWLGDLAEWISGRLKMNEYKRAQLESDLRTAEMNITPEKHMANAIVKAGIIGVFALPAYFIFPLASPIILVFAVFWYRQEYKSVGARIQDKRIAIENELPRLVFTIQQTLLHSRDILAMLDSYRKGAGPEMKKQLDITTADMRSGNYEAALMRFEARMGSVMVSDVCRGLQSVIRGDETSAYWASLSVKLADNHRQNMKRQAMKAPDKVRRLSMCLLFCFLLMYIVVIVSQILSSMDALFG